MKYYCIGIKGAGMSTLAQILYDLGNEVSGYDDVKEYKYTQAGLDQRGIEIFYEAHPLDQDVIVTYSVAFKDDHPELKRVKELGLKVKKYSEIMGHVIDLFEAIGVAGTHGKTSTASLLRHLLENTYGCNYFIGAGDGYVNKDNKYYVVESDEFNRHFQDYHPTYAIITNIELEHTECYRDIDDIRDTFEIFANNTKKLVIANGDNEEVRKIRFKTPFLYYGFKEDNDIVIKNSELKEDGSSFDLYIPSRGFYGHFDLPLFGEHMIANAAATITIAHLLGIAEDKIHDLLTSFHNAKRRFAIEQVDDITIIDDYAHHPTEIKATLKAARQKYPQKRLIAIFVPNTYSRTKDFKDEFIESLSLADKTYLTQIDCNREDPRDYPGISSKMIVDGIKDAELISDEEMDKLKDERNAVVAFLGCASVDHLIKAYKEVIAKRS